MPPNHSEEKNYPTPLLAHTLPILSIPVYCGMFWQTRWLVTVTDHSGSSLLTAEPGPLNERQPLRLIPSHEVRDAFLTVVTLQDAVNFVENFGPLDQSRSCTLERMLDLRDRIREAREVDPKRYFPSGKLSDLRHLFERQPWQCELLPGPPPFLRYKAQYAEEAMHQATYVDQIAGVKASTCPECGMQFAQKKKLKPKKYCDQICERRATKARWNQKVAARKVEGVHGKA